MSWTYETRGDRDVPARWSRERKIEGLTGVGKSLANKWIRRLGGYGMESGDLYSAAMIGVVKAVDTFDASRKISLIGFARLCGERNIMTVSDRYNPTSRTYRKREEFVSEVSLNSPAYEGDQSVQEKIEQLADGALFVEDQATAYSDFEDAWGNWSQALTPLERAVADVAVRRTENGSLSGISLEAECGLPRKSAHNSLERARKKLIKAVKDQGIDPETATMDELLAVRIPPRKLRRLWQTETEQC